MSAVENNAENAAVSTITPRDILFECPACGKGLVVDEEAEGMVIDCPKCHINVIVPKRSPLAPVASKGAVDSKPPAASARAGASSAASLQERLAALGNQLRELQTQRTEISNRLASRLNELNRDLVMMARLETTQQQLLAEWSQLISQLPTSSAQAAVLGASVGGSRRTRVQFGS